VVSALADVTPGWHAPTGKAIAVGARVRYNTAGQQLEDVPRAHQTGYAVYCVESGSWSRWRILQMPEDETFNFARSACAQWLTETDGTVLLPFYTGRNARDTFAVTVVRAAFDGQELTYLEHGNVLEVDVARGLVEPSLTRFRGEYFLTIRNDERGYVTRGDDGLRYKVVRHRAPLFIAQVDPEQLHVIRETEQILIPEENATLGNFGVQNVTADQTWVTVGEGMWEFMGGPASRPDQEPGVVLARIIWSQPNESL
jgi:hypothetical protein